MRSHCNYKGSTLYHSYPYKHYNVKQLRAIKIHMMVYNKTVWQMAHLLECEPYHLMSLLKAKYKRV